MKLSELNKFASELEVDPDFIIELEHQGCMKYTGVYIRQPVYYDRAGYPHIVLTPASALVRVPMQMTGEGVTSNEKHVLWRKDNDGA